MIGVNRFTLYMCYLKGKMPCDHYTEQKRVASSWSAGQCLLWIQQLYVINKSLTLHSMSSNLLFQLISPDCNSLNYYWLYTLTLWCLSIPTINSNIGSTSDVGLGQDCLFVRGRHYKYLLVKKKKSVSLLYLFFLFCF